ncbi:hypothetical protein [Colwellia sp. Bg11-28]|uniref:hypothetical protein n=1 Tax=Colwellia sp. Bg11-28 TaxID=2058305 RepID=UPI000C333D33|nr:hypothetical protein [Colwellia sp. Bg11-28]PKH88333.1 hypothetical protein CXF79_06100 [Colwellia sp. Bg11-28]
MEACEYSQGHLVSGFVELTKENIDKLAELVGCELCSAGIELYSDGDLKVHKELPAFQFEDKFVNFKVKVELVTLKIHDQYFIGDNWGKLLSYSNYVLNPVEFVFVANEMTVHSELTRSEKFTRYKNAAKVCQLIKQVANDVTASEDYLIIFGQSLSVNFAIDETALTHDIDPESLEELLSRDPHKEAKTGLVREALVTFLKNIDKAKRFTYLLTHFNAFATQLLASYEQYVNNYSFDKVRREHQEKKTEYICKINKVFDDVATKTFAIPAGVWLAASKIEEGGFGSLIFYKNIVFVLIVFVLAVIVCLNLLGQFSSLSAIKNEYTPLFERLKKEKGIDEAEVTIYLNDLKDRDGIVWWKLSASMFVAIIMFIIVIALVCGATS